PAQFGARTPNNGRRKNKRISKGKKGGKKKAIGMISKLHHYSTLEMLAKLLLPVLRIASEGLKHRVFEISLANLQNDEDHAYRK
ncbi:hypothetical protein Ccrd_026038, partial [Cynara cardunculus var. scolymus]